MDIAFSVHKKGNQLTVFQSEQAKLPELYVTTWSK